MLWRRIWPFHPFLWIIRYRRLRADKGRRGRVEATKKRGERWRMVSLPKAASSSSIPNAFAEEINSCFEVSGIGYFLKSPYSTKIWAIDFSVAFWRDSGGGVSKKFFLSRIPTSSRVSLSSSKDIGDFNSLNFSDNLRFFVFFVIFFAFVCALARVLFFA